MDNFQEILEAVLKTEIDEESELEEWFVKADVSPKGKDAVKAALRLLSAYKDELPKDALDKLAAIGGYMVPEQKAKAPAKKIDEPNPEDEEDEFQMKKDDVKKAEISAEVEEILKARDAELESLKAHNEEITKALRSEKDARELAEWTKKAETDLSHYPGKNSAELGEMLHKLASMDADIAAGQFEIMKSASEAMKESAVLKEAGANFHNDRDGSAWSKIEKMADGLVEKSDDLNMTREKAIAKVLGSMKGSALYAEYLEENPSQSRSLV